MDDGINFTLPQVLDVELTNVGSQGSDGIGDAPCNGPPKVRRRVDLPRPLLTSKQCLITPAHP